jgi:hypothetical protein
MGIDLKTAIKGKVRQQLHWSDDVGLGWGAAGDVGAVVKGGLCVTGWLAGHT